MHSKNRPLTAGIGCLILLTIGQGTANANDDKPLDSLWTRLNAIYVESNLLNTNDASQAELMLKGGIERSSTLYGANSEEVLQATLELLRLYRMQSRYGEFRAQVKKVSQIYSELPASSKTPFTVSLLDLSRDLIQHNRIEEARSLISPVLGFLNSDKFRLNDTNSLNKLVSLAQTLKSRKEHEACEAIYRALLVAYEQKQSGNELTLADMRTQLAELLKETGRASAAKELAALSLESQEKDGITCGINNITTLIILTGLDLSAGKNDEAKKMAEKLEASLSHTSFPERNNLDLLRPILDLCNQFAQKSDYQSLKALFSQSLRVAGSHSYSQYDKSLGEISRSLIDSGNADKAESLYLELAQWIERPNSFVDSNFRASVLIMLTRFYAVTAQFDKAASFMTKLADFDTQNHTHRLNEVQSNIESTNNVMIREKLYQLLADQTPKSAYELRQVANYRAKLADMYLLSKRNNEAEKQWYLITNMLQASLPRDCEDLADEVRIILKKYIYQKRYKEAQQLVNNMAAYGFDQSVFVSTSNGFLALALHQEEFSNTQKAIELAERALQVLDKYGSKRSHNYCDALTQYSVLLRKCGKVELAAEKEKQAVDLRQELERSGIRRYG